MPNGQCSGTFLGMLEYKRWCLLTEKGQTDIVTHSTNIWNKASEVSTVSKGFLSTQNSFSVEFVVKVKFSPVKILTAEKFKRGE